MTPLLEMSGGLSAKAFGMFFPSDKFSPSFESIATVTVGAGGASSISFTSIPQTYKHLQIRAIYEASATTGGTPRFTLNNDTTNQYRYHYLVGDGATASAGDSGGAVGSGGLGSGIQSTAQFAALILDILDYASTNKAKTIRNLAGFDANGSGMVGLGSSLWTPSTAITRVDFTLQSANFNQYSSFALFGLKG